MRVLSGTKQVTVWVASDSRLLERSLTTPVASSNKSSVAEVEVEEEEQDEEDEEQEEEEEEEEKEEEDEGEVDKVADGGVGPSKKPKR